MNFIKNFKPNSFFQKVVEIATQSKTNDNNLNEANINTQNQCKILGRERYSQNQNFLSNSSSGTSRFSHQQSSQYQEPTSSEADDFIQMLANITKSRNFQENEKKRKKHLFNQLQVEPLYLQECSELKLLKMQAEFGNMDGFQRTQDLHQYLSQTNTAIKNVLQKSEIDLPTQTFALIQSNSQKVSILLRKVQQLRKCSLLKNIQKQKKIRCILKKKQNIKKKIILLKKMKEKRQVVVDKPKNLDQVYFTERSRHKLYLKICNMKNVSQNAYFTNMKKQIISISSNNIAIIDDNFKQWLSLKVQNSKFPDKLIEKLLICLYFVKNERIYKDNNLDYNFDGIKKKMLVPLIEQVKTWKNYRYIRDPSMKAKIGVFLDYIIGILQKEK